MTDGSNQTKMTWQDFERYVELWLKKAWNTHGEVTVRRGERRMGLSGEYSLDVSAEFEAFGGARFLVTGECKHLSRPVEREMILVVKARMDELKAQKGMVFSTSGFQTGAFEYAMAHSIALLEVLDGAVTYKTRGSEVTPPPSWPKVVARFQTSNDSATGKAEARDVSEDDARAMESFLVALSDKIAGSESGS